MVEARGVAAVDVKVLALSGSGDEALGEIPETIVREAVRAAAGTRHVFDPVGGRKLVYSDRQALSRGDR
jgi:hypothetical protein